MGVARGGNLGDGHQNKSILECDPHFAKGRTTVE